MISLLSLGSTAFGQWQIDTVKMGASSANDVFYSLATGTVKTENGKNWHVAFSLAGAPDSGAVWANHNSGNSFVKVYNVHKDLSQWATVTLADTTTSTLSFNNDQGWDQGAFNMNGSSNTQYGWGHYDFASHDLVGDSIFIVKANGVFYKFAINSLTGTGASSGNWNIQMDTFSGPIMYDTIKFANYTDRHFAYYNFATISDTNREPSKPTWDLVFNRYSTNDPLSGPRPFNSVIGALSNVGVKVAKANAIHVDSAFAHYGDYVYPSWAPDATVISKVGYNWKTFTPPTTWSVPDSVSYLIQDVLGNLYQLQFLSYSGSAGGAIELRKRMIIPVVIVDPLIPIHAYDFFPNPVQNNLIMSFFSD